MAGGDGVIRELQVRLYRDRGDLHRVTSSLEALQLQVSEHREHLLAADLCVQSMQRLEAQFKVQLATASERLASEQNRCTEASELLARAHTEKSDVLHELKAVAQRAAAADARLAHSRDRHMRARDLARTRLKQLSVLENDIRASEGRLREAEGRIRALQRDRERLRAQSAAWQLLSESASRNGQ